MRTEADLRAMTIAQYRRRLGMVVAECTVAYREARMFMVGQPRREIEALRARDRSGARAEPEALARAPPRRLAPGVPPHIRDVNM